MHEQPQPYTEIEQFAFRLASENLDRNMNEIGRFYHHSWMDYFYSSVDLIPTPRTKENEYGFRKKIDDIDKDRIAHLPAPLQQVFLTKGEITSIFTQAGRQLRITNSEHIGLIIGKPLAPPTERPQFVSFYSQNPLETSNSEGNIREYLQSLKHNPLGLIESFDLAKKLLLLAINTPNNGHPHILA